MTGPAAADRVRLAEHIASARQLLAAPDPDADKARWAYRCGQLEALLELLCEAAERAFGEPDALAGLEARTPPLTADMVAESAAEFGHRQ